ncbi:MAG: ATP-binding cassette domain-containing protein [Caldilineaceae bacterium]|nr:ATP-binding cassette domain-containing protein [Caldilineaceae bacterium]
MSELVALQNVTRTFTEGPVWQRQSTVAVDDVSFSINSDQATITGVVGESGSGKTTLALLLLGYEKPTEGRVVFQGQDVASMSSQERLEFRRQVQPIFQDPFAAFNPFYKVDHVLTTPIKRFHLAKTEREQPSASTTPWSWWAFDLARRWVAFRTS